MMHQQAASSHYNSAQGGSQHYQGQPIAMMGQSGQGSSMMGQRPMAPYRPSQQGTAMHLQSMCSLPGLGGQGVCVCVLARVCVRARERKRATTRFLVLHKEDAEGWSLVGP